MTQRLYLNDPAPAKATVNVLSCQPDPSSGFRIILEATPFHPQGGGQPSDTGYLRHPEGPIATVRHVIQDDSQTVVHLTDVALPLGEAEASVCMPQRLWHAQLHSAGHLIAHLLSAQGWQPVKAHHWPGECRITLSPTGDNLSVPAVVEVQAWCDQAINSDTPVVQHLDANGLRQVAMGPWPAFPCGGTHVASLQQLLGLEVQAIKMKKGRLQVSYQVPSTSPEAYGVA